MTFPSYYLYHFRPDKKPRDLNTLLANQLWSASIESLNDPAEFIALRALPADKQREFKQVGVTCFCRSLTNPLLWSHYAAAHGGFAIGYDATHPFFGGDQGILKRFALDVRYEDVPPSLERFDAYELPMVAMNTKPTCWAYEQEVRLIKQVGNQAFNVPPDAIKELALGAKMPDDRANEIVAAVKAARINVKVARMRFLDEGYGVKPQWIKSITP
jgi:hypothetical protein